MRNLRYYAREMLKAQTEAERVLWKRLRRRQLANVKFRRQEPLGPYIVDFVSYEAKLVVELDGGQHNQPTYQSDDRRRTRWLQSEGFRVIRFWNNEVHSNIEGVVEQILEELDVAG